MNNTFGNDLIATLCFIVKLVLLIVIKVRGILSPLVWWKFIVVILLAEGIPMGGTMAFVILKLTKFLPVGWAWIILTMILDRLMLHAYRLND